MKEKVKLTVEMEVTESQALALISMFDYWNNCGDNGMSRKVSFYVDGDGDFKPRCRCKVDKDIHELTNELRQLAVIEDLNDGDRIYDYGSIACRIDKDK